MWAIDSMFGTGILGFGIITAILTFGTYVVVFLLLHPDTQAQVIEWVKKKMFRLLRCPTKKNDTQKQKHPASGGSGKGQKGDEEMGNSTAQGQVGLKKRTNMFWRRQKT
jgi:hypothetical protein